MTADRYVSVRTKVAAEVMGKSLVSADAVVARLRGVCSEQEVRAMLEELVKTGALERAIGYRSSIRTTTAPSARTEVVQPSTA